MINLIIQVSKYLIIILMALYTFQSYTVFRKRDEDAKHYLFLRQNMLMFSMHFVAFMVLYLQSFELNMLIFYGAQVIYLAAVLVLYCNLYPRASRLLINNMCMLICISFIMITRLSYDQCVKQFKIAVAASIVALLIPVLIRKLRFITKMYWVYTLLGIGMLALVAIAARSTYGAKLSFTVGGISIQPSEFVKIIYVFAIAGLLTHARDFRRIALATVLAALHVLILVVSKDLGSALIFFVTYLVMLFVSTRNPFYVLAGILSGSGAAVAAYFLFAHVRVRVHAWQNPFMDYQGGGYQICQSLFSISAGSWFGTGLGQGSPEAIPFVEQDAMFPAICEELGSIFGICLILVCMSCFIMFVNISMQLTNRYYRLVAVGLGATYASQIFLTIGGGIKLIPLTGVTLPLVSYGGSSMLSTLIMFAIVQGLYMLRRDEESKNEEKRRYQAQQLSGGQYQSEYGDPGQPYYPTQDGQGYPGGYGYQGYGASGVPGNYANQGYPGYEGEGAPGGYGYPDYEGQRTSGGYGYPDYEGQRAPGGYGYPDYEGQGTPGGYGYPDYEDQGISGDYGYPDYEGQGAPGGYGYQNYEEQGALGGDGYQNYEEQGTPGNYRYQEYGKQRNSGNYGYQDYEE